MEANFLLFEKFVGLFDDKEQATKFFLDIFMITATELGVEIIDLGVKRSFNTL